MLNNIKKTLKEINESSEKGNKDERFKEVSFWAMIIAIFFPF